MFVYRHAGLADVTTTISALGDAGRHGRRRPSALAPAIERRLDEIQAARRRAGRGRGRCSCSGASAGAARHLRERRRRLPPRHARRSAGGDNVFADVHAAVGPGDDRADPRAAARRRSSSCAPSTARDRRRSRRASCASGTSLRVGPGRAQRPRASSSSTTAPSFPGPRVAEGTELIARALHPEAFAK